MRLRGGALALGAVELAEVGTYAPANGELDCGSALTVATEVWEHLPDR
jgi:hypothetical protein